MPSKKGPRPLELAEVQRLLSVNEIKRHEQSKSVSTQWPGAYNLRLLAEAVSKRNPIVIFDNERRFIIRYESKFDAVFVKPENGDFVPCGYFPYKRLKEVLASDEPS